MIALSLLPIFVMWLLQYVSRFNKLQWINPYKFHPCRHEIHLSCSLWCCIPSFFYFLILYKFLLAMRSIIVEGKTFSFYILFLAHLVVFPCSSPHCFHILNQPWAKHWVASLSYMLALCSSLLAFAAYYRLGREVKCIVFFYDSAEVYPYISEFGRKNVCHGWLAVMKDINIKINSSGEN